MMCDSPIHTVVFNLHISIEGDLVTHLKLIMIFMSYAIIKTSVSSYIPNHEMWVVKLL